MISPAGNGGIYPKPYSSVSIPNKMTRPESSGRWLFQPESSFVPWSCPSCASCAISFSENFVSCFIGIVFSVRVRRFLHFSAGGFECNRRLSQQFWQHPEVAATVLPVCNPTERCRFLFQFFENDNFFLILYGHVHHHGNALFAGHGIFPL